jgi:dihydroxyacid dehydratase/phosphogluconate dehydratase
MAENFKRVALKRVAWNSDQEVVRPVDRPLTATGVVRLRGNLAPEGATVKVAGMDNGPEPAVGGPIGVVRDGDIIAIDADHGSLEVQLSDVEFEKRRATWQPRGSAFESGYLWKYAQQVGSARHGAVTHPGGAAEKACYADI